MALDISTGKLSSEKFNELLVAPDTPDWLLRNYVMEDVENSKPFHPALKSRQRDIDPADVQVMGGMEYWNKREHDKRVLKYRKRIADGYSGLKVVSEGDSWFLYPLIVREVVDHLNDRYAIYSLGAAGDDLSQIVEQDEFLPAIAGEEADIFLISAGGNDVLGNIVANLHQYNPGFSAVDYPNSTFGETLDRLEALFRQIFARITRESPEVKTFCHGYDYVFPRKKGKWLGKPMSNELGITDPQLQYDIARVLIDQFNNRLSSVAGEFSPSVSYVDCRTAVPNERDWYDEIHPNSSGFGEIASRFVRAIEGL